MAPPQTTIAAGVTSPAGGSCHSRVSSPDIVYSSRWRRPSAMATSWDPITPSASNGVAGVAPCAPSSSPVAAPCSAIARP